MTHVRRHIIAQCSEKKIIVPTPLAAEIDLISQDKLEGFETLDKAWLRNPSNTLKYILEVLPLISSIPARKIYWPSIPEITNVDCTLIQKCNTLHYLAQEALSDEKIRMVVAAPLFTPTNTQFIHGDFKPDNLLISKNGSSTALVDWENSGIGHPDFDLASLLAGLIFVSVRSVVKEDDTDWISLNKFLKNLDFVAKTWMQSKSCSDHFHIILAKYLFVRLCGYYNEIEEDDRCAFVMKTLLKNYATRNSIR